MTYVLFAIWSLACFGAGAAAIIGLGMMIDKRRHPPRPGSNKPWQRIASCSTTVCVTTTPSTAPAARLPTPR